MGLMSRENQLYFKNLQCLGKTEEFCATYSRVYSCSANKTRLLVLFPEEMESTCGKFFSFEMIDTSQSAQLNFA